MGAFFVLGLAYLIACFRANIRRDDKSGGVYFRSEIFLLISCIYLLKIRYHNFGNFNRVTHRFGSEITVQIHVSETIWKV